MIIPPVKLVAGGRIVDDVFRLVLAQIRSKHETAGDFRAQIAANATGVRRHRRRSSTRHGRDDARSRRWRSCSTTPSAARAAELAALPHGVYEAEGSVDNDGYTDEPVRLQARVEIGADGVRFDTTGSDPQRRAPVNSTYAMTFSACAYALKCLIDPDLPVNDGFYRLVTLARARRARSRTARWPAPVVGGWETHDAPRRGDLPRAAARRSPSGCPAGTKGMMCQAGFGSLDVAARAATRASTRRSPAATAAGSRATAPTRCRRTARTPRTRRSRRPSSTTRSGSRGSRSSRTPRARAGSAAGSGCARTTVFDRRRRSRSSPTATASARGASFGGHDAARRRVRPRSATASRRGSARRRRVDLEPGDVISVRTLRRRRLRAARGARPERVLRDVLEGKVSAERARERVPGRDRRPPASTRRRPTS